MASFATGSGGLGRTTGFGGGGSACAGGSAVTAVGERAMKRICSTSSACGATNAIGRGRMPYQITTTNSVCSNTATTSASQCCRRSCRGSRQRRCRSRAWVEPSSGVSPPSG
ncbi:hypothetical protein [Rhodanobacter panaciterrae]|uniref:hypothetical protein n=1 Tax=Rhodanobacter panaciterrae TaxID=490572 RepID=UPI001E42DA3C|nr:hypothetical protein [Rhodanobacter panaciterrae]